MTGGHRRSFALLVGMAMVLMLAAFSSPAAAAPQDPGALPDQSLFKIQNDTLGADDQPGQKDLNSQGIYSPAPGDLWVQWQWDDTSVSGGNTGDACALFDSGTLNGKVNFAVCVTMRGNPAGQDPDSPRVYTCGDGKVDRCTSTYTQVALGNTGCVVVNPVSDPFAGVGSHKGNQDTRAVCHIDLNAVGGASNAKLVNTCSYPSREPTSAPSDCVLIPADSFLKIVKNASPINGTFDFTTPANANGCSITTVSGTGECILGVASGTSFSVTEVAQANWGITGTPSCTNSTTTPAYSNGTISNIKAASDATVTCTFNNVRLTGAIKIIKKRTGTDTTLQGAHFTIDGAGDYTTGADGTVCVGGLDLGNHTINETAAPNGHSIPSPSSQVVNVANAGTCASTPTEVTVYDDVVLGKIDIKKYDEDGGTLNGATFTLHNDISSSPDYVPGTDTATSTTCSSFVMGVCTLFNVPLGEYWVVETTPPNGYNTAEPQHVTIGVGTAPATGVTITLEFTDLPEDGTVLIEKTGLDGDPLDGAEFTLYVKNNDDSVGASTGKKCTTGETGDVGACEIPQVPLGTYWLIETVVPDGYAKAPNRTVVVGLGDGPGQGDEVTIEISNSAKPGTVSITKTDDAGNALKDATFTLYNDLSSSSTFDPPTDTSTGLTCTTAATIGTCSIPDVPLGDYWVVETGVPDHYDAAAPRSITVGLGADAETGDIVDVPTFIDNRQHRVVVLVCHEGTDTLASSAVKIGTETKQSLEAGSLTGQQQKELCDTGGANFGDISGHGKITAEIDPADPGH